MSRSRRGGRAERTMEWGRVPRVPRFLRCIESRKHRISRSCLNHPSKRKARAIPALFIHPIPLLIPNRIRIPLIHPILILIPLIHLMPLLIPISLQTPNPFPIHRFHSSHLSLPPSTRFLPLFLPLSLLLLLPAFLTRRAVVPWPFSPITPSTPPTSPRATTSSSPVSSRSARTSASPAPTAPTRARSCRKACSSPASTTPRAPWRSSRTASISSACR